MSGSDENFIESELESKSEKDKDVMKYKNKKRSTVIYFPTNLSKRPIGGNDREKNSQSIDDLDKGAGADIQR